MEEEEKRKNISEDDEEYCRYLVQSKEFLKKLNKIFTFALLN